VYLVTVAYVKIGLMGLQEKETCEPADVYWKPSEMPVPETFHSIPGGHVSARNTKLLGPIYTFLELIELMLCKLTYSVYP
jgi:hypothetical protein